jgi:hypothetical protein
MIARQTVTQRACRRYWGTRLTSLSSAAGLKRGKKKLQRTIVPKDTMRKSRFGNAPTGHRVRGSLAPIGKPSTSPLAGLSAIKITQTASCAAPGEVMTPNWFSSSRRRRGAAGLQLGHAHAVAFAGPPAAESQPEWPRGAELHGQPLRRRRLRLQLQHGSCRRGLPRRLLLSRHALQPPAG